MKYYMLDYNKTDVKDFQSILNWDKIILGRYFNRIYNMKNKLLALLLLVNAFSCGFYLKIPERRIEQSNEKKYLQS